MATTTIQHRRNTLAREEWKKFDDYSHAVTVIDEMHRMIHDGFSFHATARNAALLTATNADFLIDVPAGCYPHINGILFSLGDAPCDVQAYEGVTVSASGTPITAFNRNRNSSNASLLGLYSGPTITDLGALIHDRYVPTAGGTGVNQVGTLSPTFGEEWILKPNTKYLVRLTNRSGGTIEFGGEMLWYEPGYPSKDVDFSQY